MSGVDQQPSAVAVGRDDCPSPHSLGNKMARVAWAIVWSTLFRCSPRLMFGWRRMLLRMFGAAIGSNARISPSVRIWAPWNLVVGDESSIAHDVDCYSVNKLTIGSHATVSQYAFLCTASHDTTDPHMKLISAPITIEPGAWVCARAFVAPGVVVASEAVVGAQAVVTKSVAARDIVAGNPAKVIGRRTFAQRESVE